MGIYYCIAHKTASHSFISLSCDILTEIRKGLADSNTKHIRTIPLYLKANCKPEHWSYKLSSSYFRSAEIFNSLLKVNTHCFIWWKKCSVPPVIPVTARDLCSWELESWEFQSDLFIKLIYTNRVIMNFPVCKDVHTLTIFMQCRSWYSVLCRNTCWFISIAKFGIGS